MKNFQFLHIFPVKILQDCSFHLVGIPTTLLMQSRRLHLMPDNTNQSSKQFQTLAVRLKLFIEPSSLKIMPNDSIAAFTHSKRLSMSVELVQFAVNQVFFGSTDESAARRQCDSPQHFPPEKMFL